MLSRGELQPIARGAPIRYVYVKMLTDQADTQEGKVLRGQILVIPEDKATRWVYRSRIARPASKDEYDNFQRKMASASRTGQGIRRRRSPAMVFPEQNPFQYVEETAPEWNDALADNAEADPNDRGEVRLVGAGGRGDNTDDNLSVRLGSVNREALDDSDDEDGDDESEYPGDDEEEREPQVGHYRDAITSGPGQEAEQRPRARARSRSKPSDE